MLQNPPFFFEHIYPVSVREESLHYINIYCSFLLRESPPEYHVEDTRYDTPSVSHLNDTGPSSSVSAL